MGEYSPFLLKVVGKMTKRPIRIKGRSAERVLPQQCRAVDVLWVQHGRFTGFTEPSTHGTKVHLPQHQVTPEIIGPV